MISTWGQGRIVLLIGQGCVINCINWLIVKGHKPVSAVIVTVELVFERAQEIYGGAMLLCHRNIIKIVLLQLARNYSLNVIPPQHQVTWYFWYCAAPSHLLLVIFRLCTDVASGRLNTAGSFSLASREWLGVLYIKNELADLDSF